MVNSAYAGTLESSDVYIQINPIDGNKVEIELESSVEELYGEMIIKLIEDTLKEMEVNGVHVHVQDKGALDFVIKARLQSAVLRATEMSRNPDWEKIS